MMGSAIAGSRKDLLNESDFLYPLWAAAHLTLHTDMISYEADVHPTFEWRKPLHTATILHAKYPLQLIQAL
jgi:hypothetical protein